MNFIKIHAPIEILYDLAEEFQMKMPTHWQNIGSGTQLVVSLKIFSMAQHLKD